MLYSFQVCSQVNQLCVFISHSVVSDSLQPMDCSPPDPSVHGIFQARILEWVAISFSRESSQPRDRTQVSHIAGRRFNLWAIREAYIRMYMHIYVFEKHTLKYECIYQVSRKWGPGVQEFTGDCEGMKWDPSSWGDEIAGLSLFSEWSGDWVPEQVPACWVVSDSLQPMDCSSPASSVQWISQARILEGVAISF